MSKERKCQKCKAVLTPKNTKRYLSPSHCDSCEWAIRDDLAWLTGTGRWGQ